MVARRDQTDNEARRGSGWNPLRDLFEGTASDVRELCSYLILQRELLRDQELERLESEAAKLLGRVERLEREKLVEELTCFREVLELHRASLKANGG